MSSISTFKPNSILQNITVKSHKRGDDKNKQRIIFAFEFSKKTKNIEPKVICINKQPCNTSSYLPF